MLRTFPVLAAFALALAIVPPAAAEEPTEGTCDDTGVLVCAGADAGANVTCAIAGAVASCSWTRGNVWTAYSPVGLSGSATVAGAGTLRVCIDTACSTAALDPYAGACDWIAILECDGDFRDEGDVGPITLAMGQCLRVEVIETVHVDAWAPSFPTTLVEVAWDNHGEGAGAVCLVDDGRN